MLSTASVAPLKPLPGPFFSDPRLEPEAAGQLEVSAPSTGCDITRLNFTSIEPIAALHTVDT